MACVMPVVTEFVTLLLGGLRDGISGLSGIAPAVFDEPGMYSVGSGMVLAIGDLAGATVVTLLAATASLPEWVAMDDRDRSCRDRRGDRAARYGTRRVAQKIRGNHSLRK